MKEDGFYPKNAWKYGIFCISATALNPRNFPRPPPPPPPGHKTKMPFPRKNTPKGDISGITEIDDIHPRKYSISAETPR